MLEVYVKSHHDFSVKKISFDLSDRLPENILWIDLLYPTHQEISYVSTHFSLCVPGKEEREEIELSARYWEDSANITINTHFLVRHERGGRTELIDEVITFMTSRSILFTVRFGDLSLFDEIQGRILASPRNFEDGFDVVDKIFEIRVEKDADILEWIDKESRKLRKIVLEDSRYAHSDVLRGLSSLQELNMSVRDSLFDKRRALTSLIKSDKIDADTKRNLTIVLKDANSLVEFSMSNLNVLDNVQNMLTSRLNIDQSKTIKIFTVATVAMMPPTLIGTIYGMNFDYIPELRWEFGYPVAVIVMIISTILPIVYFRKKGWL